jgi:hypothetical protein
MSVGRSKYGWPAWLRIDDIRPEEDRYHDWGIVGFQVGDIPSPLQHEGASIWSFQAIHVPLKNNYPHSEVRCFAGENHVQASECLPLALHLRWRKQLLWKIRVKIRPGQTAVVPLESPSI